MAQNSTSPPPNLGYSRLGRKPDPALEAVRIAGVQFLRGDGGATLLVPQRVIDVLAKLGVKSKAGGPSLDRLIGALEALKVQIDVLTGVQI